jgi:hypothetical protein
MKEKHPIATMANFFNEEISPEDFARNMRRLLHETLMLNFQSKGNGDNKAIEAGYFWLTKFCEHLDPVMTKRDEEAA